MFRRIRHPSPAMVIALIALFFALGGAAGAVTAVPLAKRALNADNAGNAKHLDKKTLTQVTAMPGPTLVSTRTASVSLGSEQEGYFPISCDTDQRAIAGGYSTPTAVLAFDTYPMSDSTWRVYLANLTNTPATATVYVVCVAAPVTPPGTTFPRATSGGKAVAKTAPVRGYVR